MTEKQAQSEAAQTNDAAALKRQMIVEKAAQDRTRQALELQRERILSERTSSPVRRAALEAALVHIETQIEQLVSQA